MTNNNENKFGGYVPDNNQNSNVPDNAGSNWYASKSYAENDINGQTADNNIYSTSQNNGEPVASAKSTPNTAYGDNYTETTANTQSFNVNDIHENTGYSNGYTSPTADSQPNRYSNAVQTYQIPNNQKKAQKKKGKGAMVAVIAICLIGSGVFGFGGTMLAQSLASNGVIPSGGMTIQKVVTSEKTSDEASGEMSTKDIAAATENSVVEITTETVQTGSLSKQYIKSGAGSGVIISADGYIITNNHVIDGAEKIVVTLRDGTTYDATLVGKDSQVDVALLKVEATSLSAATFANSDDLQVGENVVAIGNPLGQLGGTVTEGIVSATSRNLDIDGNTMSLIQTSAAINPGNSGGGLFNGHGELVGLVVAKTVDTGVEGLGFAIPINNVESILSNLKEYGYVRGRAVIGVSLVDVANSQTAMMYGVDKTGVYVSSITGTEAKTAGFQVGDLITKVNDTEVSSSDDIKAVVKNCKAGDTLKVTVERNGSTTDLSTVLAEDTSETGTEQATSGANNGFNGGYSNGNDGYSSGNGGYSNGNDGYSSDNAIEDFYNNYFGN